MEGGRVVELESKVAALSKDNSRLKNELRFTKETERRAAAEQINSLRRTLDMLQAKNEQISADLMQAEARLKNNEISQAKDDASSSAKLAAQSAALVERLSSVQRERERTLATELRKAINEKKEFERQLRKSCSGTHYSSTDTEDAREDALAQCPQKMLEMVDKLQEASGVADLQQMGDELLSLVRQTRRHNEMDIKSTIKMLKQKQLEAEGKKIELEEQIGKFKRQLEMTKMEYKLVDKTRIKSLQTQLQAAIFERDKWQEKAEKFEDKLETLQILNSLQKSLSKEDEIKENYEKQMEQLQQDIELVTQQCSQLLEDRTHLLQERTVLLQRLEQYQEEYRLSQEMCKTAQDRYKQERDRADRLNRLVGILRRKLNPSSEQEV